MVRSILNKFVQKDPNYNFKQIKKQTEPKKNDNIEQNFKNNKNSLFKILESYEKMCGKQKRSLDDNDM